MAINSQKRDDPQSGSSSSSSAPAAAAVWPVQTSAKDPWSGPSAYDIEKEKIARETAAMTYKNQILQAQTKPQDLAKTYADYQTNQTKTAADYSATMEKNLATNLEQMKAVQARADAAELAYQNKMAPQYGAISSAQDSVSQAMKAASAAYANEQQSATDFFNSDVKGRYTSAMDKAAADYAATKAQVQAKMDATDAYYQNRIKPQYAKLMEGGLSLRDASDPSNYVSTGVQNAYNGLIDKSAAEAEALSKQTKASGQADYGVLAALGAQARGSSQAPMTGAQQQLATATQQSQASTAYQNAMKRVADIENQQRLYAQTTRQTGLESGMNQAWKNYGNYQTSTGLAQQADINNYNAQLAGTSQLGNLTSQAANTQFQGTQGLSNARSTLSGDIANLIQGGMNANVSGAGAINSLANTYGNFAGTEMNNAQWTTGLQQTLANDALMKNNVIPEFNYNTQSGFNQGNYGVQTAMQDLGTKNQTNVANIDFAQQMQEANIATQNRQQQEALQQQKWLADNQIAAAQAQAQAQSDAGFWSSVLGVGGTLLGGTAGLILSGGNPMGGMAGASIGGGLGSGMSGMLGYGNSGGLQQGVGTAANIYANMQKAKTPTYGSVGVSPTMQGYTLPNLGIDPSLRTAPASIYNLPSGYYGGY